MEPKFKTSFIPKKSLEADVGGSTPGRYVNRRTVNGPGFYLTFLIFLLSIGAAVGVFGYTEVKIKQVDEKVKNLLDVRAAFRPEHIAILERVDTRFTNATRLLGEHVATTELFDLLEHITLKKLRYTELSYQGGAQSARGEAAPARLVISGEGEDMKAVAQQVMQYAADEGLHTPIVNTLARAKKMNDSEDGVEVAEFSLSLTVDPRLISYAATFEEPVEEPASQNAESAGEPSLTAVNEDAIASSTSTSTEQQ